ncbi:primosome component related protein [Lactobacillus selangorensis]|uniref:Primosome component related protein n=1 Tax=Lactobacillus selangorensis TaxID=81857 RepID=A0A0R2FVG8_9LACO|nr:DnaD domain protein [Lactobacillus selangorensis]KRN29495.1 primosome component related protein [Lactobacillus selangorensis]KRN33975.1 primosome component related protein [Lactobacillus selangorensis]
MPEKALTEFLTAGETTISNLILAHYHEIGMTDEQLLLYLQLQSFTQRGNGFPDLNEIAKRLNCEPGHLFELLHGMIQQKLIVLESVPDKQGKLQDHYDLTPIFDKLLALTQQADDQQVETAQQTARAEVFNQIEREFGRPLSPIETETIADWLDSDHYQPEMIEMALREAVLNQAYSLKYMDRILLNWERKNIHTKEQVQKERERHNRL